MARWPVQHLRDRHYAMLRAAYEGLSNEAIARAFHCHRWTVGNLLNSPAARLVLIEWHSAAHRLALDHPLRTLIVPVLGLHQFLIFFGNLSMSRRCLR